MAKIKIIEVPPGFAPLEVRKQWVGIEIPLAENPIPEEKISLRLGNENIGGYAVKGTDAVKALEVAGKQDAAEFWEGYSSGDFVFKKEFCELIQ